MTTENVYGEFFIDPTVTIPTEHASHIRGCRVGRVKGEFAGIDLHYEVDGKPRSMTIDRGNAMYLLSLLKCLQLNEGLPFPDDPRDPNWRAA